MKINNEFTVGVPVEEAWKAILDLESIAPCLPGAAITEQDGEDYKGTMTVKIGPVTAKYNGTVTYQETDDSAHRAVLYATGRDARGQGTASATITSSLEEVSEGTKVSVETDMKLTGRAAQFGRGIAQDVASKMLGRFADCVEQRLSSGAGQATEAPDSGDAAAAEASASSTNGGGGSAPTSGAAAASVGGPGGTMQTPGGAPAGAASGSAGAGQAASGSLAAPVGVSSGDGASGGESSGAGSAASGGEQRSQSQPSSQSEPEPLDLGEMSQEAILKRVTPVLIGAGALLAVLLVFRRLRRN